MSGTKIKFRLNYEIYDIHHILPKQVKHRMSIQEIMYNQKEYGPSLWEMEVQGAYVTWRAIWEVKIKIKQT